MLRQPTDTLLGDHVGAAVLPSDPAILGAFARRAPARNPGVAASTAGAAARPTAAVAACKGRPLALGRHLEIALGSGRDLTLRVADDGIGMDPPTAEHGRDGHFGLPGMRERASRIGATLSMTSTPGAGPPSS